MTIWINWVYILSALLFGVGLKMLSSPDTARRGNLVSAAAMFLAVTSTLFHHHIIDLRWIAGGVAAGALVGVMAARFVTMTAMPEMVALFNGFGGVASLLVAWSEFQVRTGMADSPAVPILLATLIGGITFSGSLVAFLKLRDFSVGSLRIGRALLFPGQQALNGLMFAGAAGAGVWLILYPENQSQLYLIIVGASFLLGILAVIPIGGADMPVVISLLNSYSGLAACAAGFAVQNNILIVAGSLVGASGIILTKIMCKAMNRSLSNVLFSGFGAVTTGGDASAQGEAKPITAEDVYYILEAASSVVFVPGYGLAVAQAQHAVKELGELLEANGSEVRYAIHPVAGRMPGHMNVLLAEADVPYDQLSEMDDINPVMETVDVAMVIGANDVVNPAARDDETCSIYGMPVIEVDRARTVIVSKRSMAAGFAGIPNPLFFKDNTRMLFGDAKATLRELIAEFKH